MTMYQNMNDENVTGTRMCLGLTNSSNSLMSNVLKTDG